jgi:hypothetical protein
MWPAKLIEAESDDSACRLHVALDQETHGDCRSVPTACCQTLEHGVLRRRRVEMERLRIELRGKAPNPLLIDSYPAGAKVCPTANSSKYL